MIIIIIEIVNRSSALILVYPPSLMHFLFVTPPPLYISKYAPAPGHKKRQPPAIIIPFELYPKIFFQISFSTRGIHERIQK